MVVPWDTDVTQFKVVFVDNTDELRCESCFFEDACASMGEPFAPCDRVTRSDDRTGYWEVLDD
jgi:hypothetical protein